VRPLCHGLRVTLGQQTAAHEALQESATHFRLDDGDGRPLDCGGFTFARRRRRKPGKRSAAVRSICACGTRSPRCAGRRTPKTRSPSTRSYCHTW
jgi:hypothetical protein